jgi:hypothetical protein
VLSTQWLYKDSEMIVPEYWAEAKVKDTVANAQLTLMRYGWSDVSVADAQSNARARAEEAMARAKAGEHVRKRDHKVSYNGAEGLPIREEIIARRDDVVITRNTYGALCLNTPDVLFADVDVWSTNGDAEGWAILIFMGLTAVTALGGWYLDQWLAAAALCVLWLLLSGRMAQAISARRVAAADSGAAPQVIPALQAAIDAYIALRPQAHLRVYRTPNGYRVLALHRTFEPQGPESTELFELLGADKTYVQMCRNQRCFRARLTPKPWRMGLDKLGPRPGVWPIKPARLPARRDWVKQYERAASAFSACQYIASFGSRQEDSKARVVCALHDDYCRALRALPMA